MVFEDNENQLISKFIIRAYTKDICNTPEEIFNKTKILFTRGNRNIIHLLDNKLEHLSFAYDNLKQENVVIFLDMPYDGAQTNEIYENILDYLELHNLKNIVIMPIPCIEFFVLKAFVNMYDYTDEYHVFDYNYTDSLLFRKYPNLKCDSFEIFCKQVLQKLTKVCMFPKEKNNKGKFYYEDCPCQIMCKENPKLTLEYKAQLLISNLPCFNNLQNNNINSKTVRFEELQGIADSIYQDIITIRNSYFTSNT